MVKDYQVNLRNKQIMLQLQTQYQTLIDQIKNLSQTGENIKKEKIKQLTKS